MSSINVDPKGTSILPASGGTQVNQQTETDAGQIADKGTPVVNDPDAEAANRVLVQTFLGQTGVLSAFDQDAAPPADPALAQEISLNRALVNAGGNLVQGAVAQLAAKAESALPPAEIKDDKGNTPLSAAFNQAVVDGKVSPELLAATKEELKLNGYDPAIYTQQQIDDYLEANPDVDGHFELYREGLDPEVRKACALNHWAHYGRFEERQLALEEGQKANGTALGYHVFGTAQSQVVPREDQDALRAELTGAGFDFENFDHNAYLAANPDVVQAYNVDSGRVAPDLAAAYHYQNFGRTEGRPELDPTAEVQGVVLNLEKMSQAEIYDYARDIVTSQDPKAWNDASGAVNVIGLRNYQQGVLGPEDSDRFDDTIVVARQIQQEDGSYEKQVLLLPASVDAGAVTRAQLDALSPDLPGTLNLENGIYRDAFEIRDFYTDRGEFAYSGLQQKGWLQGNFDFDLDGKVSDIERANSGQLMLGPGTRVQFHPGFGDQVGQQSLGCQLIHADHYGEFNDWLADAAQAGQKRVTYTLADGRALQYPDEVARLLPPRSYEERNDTWIASQKTFDAWGSYVEGLGGANFARNLTTFRLDNYNAYGQFGHRLQFGMSDGGIGIIITPVGGFKDRSWHPSLPIRVR